MNIYTYTYMDICKYKHIYICMYVYICIYIRVYLTPKGSIRMRPSQPPGRFGWFVCLLLLFGRPFLIYDHFLAPADHGLALHVCVVR